jgi:hypothetical protein
LRQYAESVAVEVVVYSTPPQRFQVGRLPHRGCRAAPEGPKALTAEPFEALFCYTNAWTSHVEMRRVGPDRVAVTASDGAELAPLKQWNVGTATVANDRLVTFRMSDDETPPSRGPLDVVFTHIAKGAAAMELSVNITDDGRLHRFPIAAVPASACTLEHPQGWDSAGALHCGNVSALLTPVSSDEVELALQAAAGPSRWKLLAIHRLPIGFQRDIRLALTDTSE